jgi:hypothetical protein
MSAMCKLRVNLSSPSGAGASMGVILNVFPLDLSPKLRFKADPVVQPHFMIPYVFFPWISLSWAQLTF